jgi:hypothetical protein
MRQLAAPIKIRVSTGGRHGSYMARSLVEAFDMFLNAKQPKGMGTLVEFKAKGWDPEDETFYMSTVAALEKLGRFSKG